MIYNIILFLLGFIVNFLYEVNQVKQTGKPYIFADNIWKLLFAFSCGLALLIMGPDLITSLGVTISDGNDTVFMKFHAFFICGLFPLPIFKRIMGLVKVFTGNGNGH